MRYNGGMIDHDSELMSAWDADDGFGECDVCGEPMCEDGKRCNCGVKHTVRLLVDDGTGKYVWRDHKSYKDAGEAHLAGERVKLLNEHVKAFTVCQEPDEDEDDVQDLDEDPFAEEDFDDDGDDLEDGDLDDADDDE